MIPTTRIMSLVFCALSYAGLFWFLTSIIK